MLIWFSIAKLHSNQYRKKTDFAKEPDIFPVEIYIQLLLQTECLPYY